MIEIAPESLRHEGDPPADPRPVARIGHVAAQRLDRSGLQTFCASHQPHQGRFADPVRSDQANHLPGRQIQRHIIKCGDVSEPVAYTIETGDGGRLTCTARCAHGLSCHDPAGGAGSAGGRVVSGGVSPSGQSGRLPSARASRTQATPRTPVLT